MTELHSNDAGYTHLTSGLSRSLKKLVDGLFQLNRIEYLSKGLNLLVILKNIHKDYNQQNATHSCAYGVAVRGFKDIRIPNNSYSGSQLRPRTTISKSCICQHRSKICIFDVRHICMRVYESPRYVSHVQVHQSEIFHIALKDTALL